MYYLEMISVVRLCMVSYLPELTSNLLHRLDTHKTMGMDGIHSKVLRELTEVLTKPLSIIYQVSWLTRDIPVDERLANATAIYKNNWKEDLGR